MEKQGGNSYGGRVVLRSYNNANSQGGVAYANCNNDSSNTNANNGSRLALYEVQDEITLAKAGRELSLTKPHKRR